MTKKLMIAEPIKPQPEYKGHGVYICPQFIEEDDPYSGVFADVESVADQIFNRLRPTVGGDGVELGDIVERNGNVWSIADCRVIAPIAHGGNWLWCVTLQAVLDEHGKHMTSKNPFLAEKQETN